MMKIPLQFFNYFWIEFFFDAVSIPRFEFICGGVALNSEKRKILCENVRERNF